MKILFTGASSFTGYWFVKELAAAGHEVVLTFRRDLDGYDGLRRLRVEQLLNLGRVVWDCSFGHQRFIQLIDEASGWDLLCHHAAEVSDYKSPDFDVVAAVGNNTHGIDQVLAALTAKGCRGVLLTGSVFEPGEGAGSEGLPAFSPYGLSKALTAQIVSYYARLHQMQLGKFVIPNPFGPWEEPRLTSSLVRSWFEGKTPTVDRPGYVRDNIHASLLARAYSDFTVGLSEQAGMQRLNPSGYVETQGAFVARFAHNLRDRLGLACRFELKRQEEFAEPRIRYNTDQLDVDRLDWHESRAWDDLAQYYREAFAASPAN